MSAHSSVLAWRIPGTGEPGGLPSVGSHRVRHDWHDAAAAAAEYVGLPRWHSGKESTCQYKRRKRLGFDPWIGRIPWTRKWPPTPIFLPGKFHRQRSLAGYSPWSHRVGHDWAHAEYIQNKFIYCSTNNTLYLWRLLSYSLFSVSPSPHRYLKYNVVLYQLSGKTENYQGTEEAGRTFTWDCQEGASWGIRDFNWDLKNSFRAIKDVKYK